MISEKKENCATDQASQYAVDCTPRRMKMPGQSDVLDPKISSDIISVRPVSPALGAEVTGVDLSKPVPPAAFKALEAAFLKYKVLVFPAQNITQDEMVAFTQLWGLPGEHVVAGRKAEGHHALKAINLLSNATIEGKPNGKHTDESAKRWHTDRSYQTVPAMASMLYSIEVPKSGGDTLFSNAVAAYEALPDEKKQQIDQKIAVHWIKYSHRIAGKGLASDEEIARTPPVRHPIARAHPVTGETAIYCGAHAASVEGMGETEGRALLDGLIAHIAQPQFVYRHKWRPRDLVMWDNRCTFHSATDFDGQELRVLWRTTVVGTPTL
jgi:alpha-ketoglutarate-dependent taurine dioxygenase